MMYKKLSNGISWVLHPFLLPLYLIVVLLTLTVFAHYPANVKFYLLWVVVLCDDHPPAGVGRAALIGTHFRL